MKELLNRLFNGLAIATIAGGTLLLMTNSEEINSSPMPKDTETGACIVPTDVFGEAALGGNRVARYLKCKISEEPLSKEEAENLPSFQGEDFPAPPFIDLVFNKDFGPAV